MELLVPINGTFESIHAIKKSIKLAYEYNLSIKLLYIIQPKEERNYKRYCKIWHQVDGSLINEKNDLSITIEEHAKHLLDEITKKFNFYDIKLEKQVLHGKLSKTILEFAKIEKIGLIVLEHNKALKGEHIFTGTFIQKVLSKSPCPVIVVRSEEKEYIYDGTYTFKLLQQNNS